MVVVFGDEDGDYFGWWSFDGYSEVGGVGGGRSDDGELLELLLL